MRLFPQKPGEPSLLKIMSALMVCALTICFCACTNFCGVAFGHGEEPEAAPSLQSSFRLGSGQPAADKQQAFRANWEEARAWLADRLGESPPADLPSELLDEIPPADPEDRLKALVEVVTIVNAISDERITLGLAGRDSSAAAWEEFLTGAPLPEVIRLSLAGWYALALVRHKHYDEALRILQKISPERTVAPEAVLYARAIAHFQLAEGAEAIAASRKLLEHQSPLPRRYQLVAEVVLAEASRWEKNTLREASQLMGDATRRLSFARPDPKLLPTQDRILSMLDELIDQANRSRKKTAATGSGNIRSTSPAEETLPLGGKGPGEVAPRTLSGPSDWGSLPPKQREEALQTITQKFAPHYRQIIEQYFRRLAEAPSTDELGTSGPANR